MDEGTLYITIPGLENFPYNKQYDLWGLDVEKDGWDSLFVKWIDVGRGNTISCFDMILTRDRKESDNNNGVIHQAPSSHDPRCVIPTQTVPTSSQLPNPW